MPLRRRPYFRLHSEGAEEDRYRSSLLDGFQKLVSAIWMIAVNHHGTGFFPKDCIFDGLCPAEKPRLQTPQLDQHPQ